MGKVTYENQVDFLSYNSSPQKSEYKNEHKNNSVKTIPTDIYVQQSKMSVINHMITDATANSTHDTETEQLVPNKSVQDNVLDEPLNVQNYVEGNTLTKMCQRISSPDSKNENAAHVEMSVETIEDNFQNCASEFELNSEVGEIDSLLSVKTDDDDSIYFDAVDFNN